MKYSGYNKIINFDDDKSLSEDGKQLAQQCLEQLKTMINEPKKFIENEIQTITDMKKYHNDANSFLNEHESTLRLIKSLDQLSIQNDAIMLKVRNEQKNIGLSGRASLRELRGINLINKFKEYQLENGNESSLYDMFSHTQLLTDPIKISKDTLMLYKISSDLSRVLEFLKFDNWSSRKNQDKLLKLIQKQVNNLLLPVGVRIAKELLQINKTTQSDKIGTIIKSGNKLNGVLNIEKISNRYTVKGINNKKIAKVNYASINNFTINIELIEKGFQLNDDFLLQEGYTKVIDDDSWQNSVHYILNVNEILQDQYYNIDTIIMKIFKFDGTISNKNYQSNDNFEFKEYFVEE